MLSLRTGLLWGDGVNDTTCNDYDDEDSLLLVLMVMMMMMLCQVLVFHEWPTSSLLSPLDGPRILCLCHLPFRCLSLSPNDATLRVASSTTARRRVRTGRGTQSMR